VAMVYTRKVAASYEIAEAAQPMVVLNRRLPVLSAPVWCGFSGFRGSDDLRGA